MKPKKSKNKKTAIRSERISDIDWTDYVKKFVPANTPAVIKQKCISIFPKLDTTHIIDVLDFLRSPETLKLDTKEIVDILSKSGEDPEQLLLSNPKLEKVRNSYAMEILELTNKDDVAEGVYTCGACKSTRTLTRKMQLRRADEPMTDMNTCLACGHRWNIT